MRPLLGCRESNSWLYFFRSAGLMLQSPPPPGAAAGAGEALGGGTFGNSPYYKNI